VTYRYSIQLTLLRFLAFTLPILIACTALEAQENKSASAPLNESSVSYPNKTIKIIVPFIPGSLVDVMARAFAEELQNNWKTSVVVDNKAGASTLLAAKLVASSPPDGYTLFMPTVTTFSMAPQLMSKPGIDPAKELTPIAKLAVTNLYLTIHPSFPARNMREWIEVIRKNPGKYSYGSSGNGSPQHIFMEILKKQLNLDITHIPYKGSNSGMVDLLSGQVDMSFIDGALAGPNIKSGSLIGLGSSMSKRSTLLPHVPPISETVPGFDWSGWLAFAGPANMPSNIVEMLAEFIKRYQSTPAYAQLLEKGGIEPAEPIKASDMARFIQSENRRWGPAIKASGATAD
jgi:hypothetical protein